MRLRGLIFFFLFKHWWIFEVIKHGRHNTWAGLSLERNWQHGGWSTQQEVGKATLVTFYWKGQWLNERIFCLKKLFCQLTEWSVFSHGLHNLVRGLPGAPCWSPGPLLWPGGFGSRWQTTGWGPRSLRFSRSPLSLSASWAFSPPFISPFLLSFLPSVPAFSQVIPLELLLMWI